MQVFSEVENDINEGNEEGMKGIMTVLIQFKKKKNPEEYLNRQRTLSAPSLNMTKKLKFYMCVVIFAFDEVDISLIMMLHARRSILVN